MIVDCERKESRMTSGFLADRIRRMALLATEILKAVGGMGLRMKIRNLFEDILSLICLLEVRWIYPQDSLICESGVQG